MWYKNKDNWIKSNLNSMKNFDLIVSDFMPEAFELANKTGKMALVWLILRGIGFIKLFMEKIRFILNL